MYDDELWIGKEPVVAQKEPTNYVFLARFNACMEEYTFFDARGDILTILSAAFVSFASERNLREPVDVDGFCRYVKNRMIRELVERDAHTDVFQFMTFLTRMISAGSIERVFRICLDDFNKDV